MTLRIARLLPFGILALAIAGCSATGHAPASISGTSLIQSNAGGALSRNSLLSRGALVVSPADTVHYKIGTLKPTGYTWRMPKIADISVALPYASNSAQHRTEIELEGADFNVGGQFPQPSGFTVDWYGAVETLQSNYSVSFDNANLTARIAAHRLNATTTYYFFYYDFANNQLGMITLGKPTKGIFTFPTIFEDGFVLPLDGVRLELGHQYTHQ